MTTKTRISLIIGTTVILTFAYLLVNTIILKNKLEYSEKVRIQNQTALVKLEDGLKDYVKISDLRDFKNHMDSITTSIIKQQEIKPKWVNELIKTEVIYESYDTTIINGEAYPVTLIGTHDWNVTKDCIYTEGYVDITKDSVEVAITKQKASFEITGVKYTRRNKQFKILGLSIFRYGPKEVLVSTKSNCGESNTVITQIDK